MWIPQTKLVTIDLKSRKNTIKITGSDKTEYAPDFRSLTIVYE